MKLKLDESGGVVLSDGKPVYVDEGGKEHVYDAPALRATLDRLGKDLQSQRSAAEELAEKVKAFEGLDPEKARKALELASNLDQSKLIDAGKIEEIKQAAIKSVEDKYKPISEKAEALERELYAEKVGGQFARSKFINEKLILPADMAQAAFGRHFEIKDGKVLAKDANGNLIYSDKDPGSPADFDEAMEKIVSGYAGRDKILKGTGHNGSGASGVDGGAGSRVITRAQFSAMTPDAQGKAAAAAREGKVQLVD